MLSLMEVQVYQFISDWHTSEDNMLSLMEVQVYQFI
jgi:hypothetical protein